MRQGARLDLEAESLIATATNPELLAQMYAAWLQVWSTAVWRLHILSLLHTEDSIFRFVCLQQVMLATEAEAASFY